jgi:cellobiose-specific phosphotransferase system component IIA
MICKPGMVLFAGGAEQKQEALDYIRAHELTKANVKLMKSEDEILVVTRVTFNMRI